jgi:tetratricopeptide (TPR) repeat protein
VAQVALFVACFAAAPARVFAQADSKRAQTMEHYERARKLYDINKYPEAIDEYQKAYLISDDPAMLYNIGQCYRLMNQPAEAIRFYKNYLRRAPDAPNRADVERKIAELQKAVDDEKAGPSRSPAPAPEPAAPPPPPAPPPQNQATQPPPAPTISAPPPFVAPPQAAPPVGGLADSAPVPETEQKSRFWPYTLMIGGGTMLLTSVVLAAVAASKAKAIEDAAKKNLAFNPAVERAGKNAEAGAIVTGLIGLAAGVTGTVWFLSIRSPETEAQVATSAARTGGLANAVVFPIAGAGLAGAGASFTF